MLTRPSRCVPVAIWFFVTIGAKRLLLKPASFQQANCEQNNGSSENGSASSPAINNPFLKCEKDEPEAAKSGTSDEKASENDSAKQSTNNLFKPSNNNLFANAASSTLSENSSFVFGQNLRERVVIVSESSSAATRHFLIFLFFLGEREFPREHDDQ